MAPQLLTERNRAALRIALTYLYVGFVLFLLMGLRGFVMRLSHAQALSLNPAVYDQFFTLHGAGTIAAILVGAIRSSRPLLSSTR